jgi:hypothetical protein
MAAPSSLSNSIAFALVVIAMHVSPTSASPFDGTWKHDWGCANTVGVWAARCAAEHPHFELDIWSHGNQLCGLYDVDTIDHDDSDDPGPMRGSVHGAKATLSFSSSFGSTGLAEIRIVNGKLRWKIVQKHLAKDWSGGRWSRDLPPRKRHINQGVN